MRGNRAFATIGHLASVFLLTLTAWFGVATCAPTAAAQDARLLRWKLPAGSEWKATLQQSSETRTSLRQQTVAVKLEIDLEVTWRVEESTVPERLQVRQTIDRVKLRVETGGAEAIRYDSAARDNPPASESIGKAVSQLVGTPITVVMNPRGQIETVERDTDSEKAGGPAGAGDRWNQMLLTREGMEGMFRTALLTLPETPVKPGDTWKAETRTSSPTGPVTLNQTYRWLPPDENAAADPARIDVQTEIKTDDRTWTLEEADFRGTHVFDLAAGYLQKSESTQKLVLQRKYREFVIKSEVEGRTEFTLKPAGG